MSDHDQETQGQSLAETIAGALIQRIRAGEIAHGDPLPTERDLTEAYHASRPTVREALHLVALRGYAITGGARRPRATRPTMGDSWSVAVAAICGTLGEGPGLAQFEQIRQFIETSAAAYAAREASHTQLARIAAALTDCEARLGDHPAYVAADRAFHAAIIACVGNDALTALVETLLARLIAGRDRSDAVLDNDRMSCAEHRAICKAIVARDAEGAARLMAAHLDRAFRLRLSTRMAP